MGDKTRKTDVPAPPQKMAWVEPKREILETAGGTQSGVIPEFDSDSGVS